MLKMYLVGEVAIEVLDAVVWGQLVVVTVVCVHPRVATGNGRAHK